MMSICFKIHYVHIRALILWNQKLALLRLTLVAWAGTSSFFPQQQHFAMGSLAQISFGALRCDPVQLQHQVPGKVPECTEGSAARTEVRFRKGLVQSLGWVLEDSGAELGVRFRTERGKPGCGCGGFRCRA